MSGRFIFGHPSANLVSYSCIIIPILFILQNILCKHTIKQAGSFFALDVSLQEFAMINSSNRLPTGLVLLVLIGALSLAACSTIRAVPPEINLMRVDVRDVTLSHVNLLADLRVYNPNETPLTIQGVDYTLHLEGVKVFSGRSNISQTVAPQEYGTLTLRLASAYWDIIELLNKLPDKSDVSFSMDGSILIGSSYLFARRYSFAKEGIIPLQKKGP